MPRLSNILHQLAKTRKEKYRPFDTENVIDDKDE